MLKGLERLEQRAVQQMSGEIVAPVEHDGKSVNRETVYWDSRGPMDGWAAAAIGPEMRI